MSVEIQKLPMADLHMDWSEIKRETGVNLARRKVPLGTLLPIYDNPTEIKPVSADVEGLREGNIKVFFANIYIDPEMPGFAEFKGEYSWHLNMYRDLYRERSDVLSQITSQGDLEAVLGDPTRVGTIGAVEGFPGINGNIRMLEKLKEDGVISIGPLHNPDDEIGTGHGTKETYGLTSFGKDFVRKADDMGFFIDLSHASEQAGKDMLNIVKNRPPLVTHTGSRGLVPEITRNVADEIAVEVARRGGLIGVSMASWMVAKDFKNATPEDVARTMEHYMDIMGRANISHPENFLAVGTDFNGMMPRSIIKGLDTVAVAGSKLAETMRSRGFNEGQITGILSGNAIRFLQAHLPK